MRPWERLIRWRRVAYLCWTYWKDRQMVSRESKGTVLACITLLAALLAGCSTLRTTDPAVAAAERILGPHTGGLAVSVIVPSADRDGVSLAENRLRDAVRRTEGEMARIFGGYTTHTGTHGGWLDDKGVVETEGHAAIVTTYGGTGDADQTLAAVRRLAAGLARDLNQHCVAVLVNDRMFLVPPTE
jgi:hypothetical protein